MAMDSGHSYSSIGLLYKTGLGLKNGDASVAV